MNRKSISIVIGLIIVGIIAVFVIDYSSKRPDRLGDNPYAYSVDEYKAVDPELIHYRETKNIPVSGYKPGGMSVHGGNIWLTGDNALQVISAEGIQRFETNIEGEGKAILFTGEYLFISFEDHIAKYTGTGELLATWEVPGPNCVFTSLASKDDVLYVADAGNRRIIRYDMDGNILGTFEGKAESAAGHGFIIPSANFDVVVNPYGELWAVNPGKHAIENYSDEGEMRGFWQNSSMNIEGFTGCCNPAEIAVTGEGDFVTSEKGLVRIKIYDSSGKLKSVVAPPEKFNEEGKAPEVAVDEQGVVYALDFDRSMIRIFEKIES